MAQKVGVAARQLGEVAPSWIVLIDPPPAGPCTAVGLVQPSLLLASEIVRLGREVAGRDTDAAVLRQLMGRSDAEWARAVELAAGGGDSGAVDAGESEVDSCLSLAIVATEQLAEMGQAAFSNAAIERTRRRMEVYRKCLQLWRCQDETPLAYEPGGAGGIVLVTSTGRPDYFEHTHGADYAERLEAYGAAARKIELEGAHTTVLQAVATGRRPEVTAALMAVLPPPGPIR